MLKDVSSPVLWEISWNWVCFSFLLPFWKELVLNSTSASRAAYQLLTLLLPKLAWGWTSSGRQKASLIGFSMFGNIASSLYFLKLSVPSARHYQALQCVSWPWWGNLVHVGQPLVLTVEFGFSFLTSGWGWLVKLFFWISDLLPFLTLTQQIKSYIDFSLQNSSKLIYEKSSNKK